MLAFYFDNAILYPDEACSFFYKMLFEENENKQKESGVDPSKTFYNYTIGLCLI